ARRWRWVTSGWWRRTPASRWAVRSPAAKAASRPAPASAGDLGGGSFRGMALAVPAHGNVDTPGLPALAPRSRRLQFRQVRPELCRDAVLAMARKRPFDDVAHELDAVPAPVEVTGHHVIGMQEVAMQAFQ